MGAYDVVFFDLDGTLWHNLECSNHMLRVVMPVIMERTGEKDSARITDAFNSVFLDMVREFGIYSEQTLSKTIRFKRLLERYKIRDAELAQDLANRYAAARRLYIRNFIRDDTIPMLQELQDRQISLGIVTNGVPIIQRQTLEGLGIEPFFEHVVISGLIGYQKPDRRIFDVAIQQCGRPPERILYVGDNPTVDVAGAKRVGLDSVWVFSSRQPLTRDMTMPDFVIVRLLELLPIVDGERPEDPELALVD